MPSEDRQQRALQCIRSHLARHGRTPSVRELAACMGFSSPRSAAGVIDELVASGLVVKRNGKMTLARDGAEESRGLPTVLVPIVGCAPCGAPFLAEENVEGYVQVDARLARSQAKHFIVRAVGNSMDQAEIQDGDLVLVRQQNDAANGDRVVALVDGEVTIKAFKRGQSVVSLEPKSSDPRHKPIFASSDLQIQGVVVTSLS